jgi:hypothetical protein
VTALPTDDLARPDIVGTGPALSDGRTDGVTDGTPRLTVVDRRADRRRLPWTVAALLVIAVAVFAAVTLNAVAADDAVVADELDQRIRASEIRHGQLLTEVARLESPARIAAAAERLGLQRVDHPRQLRVERLLPADGVVHDGGVVGRGSDDLKPLLARD